MKLRRLTLNVKEQNWLAVVLDFLIVILGVFLGLQVNNWNDERIASITTQKYYKRLIEDLHTEDKTRKSRVEYQQRTKNMPNLRWTQ